MIRLEEWVDIVSLHNQGLSIKAIAYLLPFAHAVDATRAAIAGDYASILPHLWWVVGYAVAITSIAVVVFKRKMNSDSM